MSIITKIKKFITDPQIKFGYLTKLGFYNNMPDEKYLKRKFKLVMGKELNLENPQTFNEKLQWLKLYDRKPEYTMMVDKYKVREYIKEKLGEEYLIPLLGVWDDPDEINFEALPNQFVLKCNHNSGTGMCICKDKSKLDIEKVKAELRNGLKENYYLTNREWPYKNVPRKIICEKYMVDENNEKGLFDYKFFCFNGKPILMYISNDISDEAKTDFYDMDFNKLNIRMKDPNSDKLIDKPIFFDKMKEIAEILSQNIPFVRVDFYYINGQIYVGELTFYHNAGFCTISPEEWNYKLGSYINLPKDK